MNRRRRAAHRAAPPTTLASRGFAPLEPAPGAARVLILGSLPGRESLAQAQYYAHPRNAFWRLMADLCGASADLPYLERTRRLTDHGVAVWDVLQAARRPGSLDSNIERASETANDLAGLLDRHPRLALIAFNGSAAAALFRRHLTPQLAERARSIELVALPSTSPAHAALSYEAKRERWHAALTPQLLNSARQAP